AALSAPPRRAGAAGRGVAGRATRRRPRPLPRPRRPPAPRGCAGATAAARRSRLLPRRSPRSASRSSSPWGEPDRARFHGAFLAPRPAWTDLLGGWPLAVAGGHGRDPNPDDAVAVDLRHLEAVAVDLDDVAHRSHPSQPVEHEPRDGLVVALVGQLQTARLGEVLEVETPVERHLTGGQPTPGGARATVELVVDLPHQLLDEVLERDDAVGAAVLVDDEGDVDPLAAHHRHRWQPRVGTGRH